MAKAKTEHEVSGPLCRRAAGLSGSLLLCLAGVISPQTAAGDTFTISEWGLACAVDNNSSPGGGYDLDFSEVVENPFHATHHAAVGGSTCDVSYDFAWAEQFGTFLIQSTQQAQGVPTSYLATRSTGAIDVTPSVDLPLSIDASWTYDLPVDWMETDFTVLVYHFQPGGSIVLFHKEYTISTYPGEPASGTLAFDAQVTLPAGLTWILRYEMELFNHGGTQGYTATGSGYANFQLSPEPASVLLLTLGFLTLSRERRRSQ